MKLLLIMLTVAGMCCTVLYGQDKRLQLSTYRYFSDKETNYMREHYHLSEPQFFAIDRLNQGYYQKLATIMTIQHTSDKKRAEILLEQQTREQKLSSILTTTQFQNFKKDMNIKKEKMQRGNIKQ